MKIKLQVILNYEKEIDPNQLTVGEILQYFEEERTLDDYLRDFKNLRSNKNCSNITSFSKVWEIDSRCYCTTCRQAEKLC
jgi:hypothetical protein